MFHIYNLVALGRQTSFLQLLRDVSTLLESNGIAVYNAGQLEMGVTRVHHHFRNDRSNSTSPIHHYMNCVNESSLSIGQHGLRNAQNVYSYELGAGSWDLVLRPRYGGCGFTGDLQDKVSSDHPSQIQLNIGYLDLALDNRVNETDKAATYGNNDTLTLMSDIIGFLDIIRRPNDVDDVTGDMNAFHPSLNMSMLRGRVPTNSLGTFIRRPNDSITSPGESSESDTDFNLHGADLNTSVFERKLTRLYLPKINQH